MLFIFASFSSPPPPLGPRSSTLYDLTPKKNHPPPTSRETIANPFPAFFTLFLLLPLLLSSFVYSLSPLSASHCTLLHKLALCYFNRGSRQFIFLFLVSFFASFSLPPSLVHLLLITSLPLSYYRTLQSHTPLTSSYPRGNPFPAFFTLFMPFSLLPLSFIYSL